VIYLVVVTAELVIVQVVVGDIAVVAAAIAAA
jgi:hypothetical protein